MFFEFKNYFLFNLIIIYGSFIYINSIINNYNSFIYVSSVSIAESGLKEIQLDDIVKFKKDENNNDGDNYINNPMVSRGLFQGDIVTDYAQLKEVFGDEVAEIHQSLRKNPENGDDNQHHRDLGLTSDYTRLWKARDKDGKIIIPYIFAETYAQDFKPLTVKSMDGISTLTGLVKFVPRESEANYIVFDSSYSGCWSYIGRRGGGQTINIGQGCNYTEIIQHEVFHALGYWHEQSRPDRDNYVDILWDNIYAGFEYNFYKQKRINSLGDSYDYASVMHYPDDGFGKIKSNCTMTPEMCDFVVTLSFRGNGQDGSDIHCLQPSSLREGAPIILTPCLKEQQYWIIEHVGENNDVVFKPLSNQNYCMAVEYKNYKVDFAPLKLQKCKPYISYPYQYQRFQLHFTDPKNIFLRWEGDIYYLVTRDSDPLNPTKSGTKLNIVERAADNYANQRFNLSFYEYPTNQCESFPAYCSVLRSFYKTIDSHGNPIGVAETLSASDILQFKLLYKCPSGPRDLKNFCTSKCKCYEGEGQCKDDKGCMDGLVCKYDGVSINRCVK